MSSGPPTVGVVLVAGGLGARLGVPVPKAFVDLAGATVLERAIRSVLQTREMIELVIVAPASSISAARDILASIRDDTADRTRIVAGGLTRQASVAAGLAMLSTEVETVLVHDAARPLAPGRLMDRVIDAVRRTGAGVIPALRVADTLKRIASPGSAVLDDGTVLEPVDRSDLVAAQTPQGFPRAPLDLAYASAREEYTDDAALFAAAGHEVRVVEGEADAFKITTPADLERAAARLRKGATVRTGIGMDVHAYDSESPLWLGGIYWPDEPGLAGHSDGDALVHAICDALLSAAGLGDLGSRFGTDEARFEDAASEVFLREVLRLVEAAGFRVGNVSVQLVAERPRFAERRVEVEAHLAVLVGAPVTVSATTSDGLGFTGRGEGVSAIAVATLTSED